jgi:hypothetical protein
MITNKDMYRADFFLEPIIILFITLYPVSLSNFVILIFLVLALSFTLLVK